MVRKELLNYLRKKFADLEKRRDILAVLLYGSQLYEEYVTNRSDIDICVVAPNCKDPVKLQLDLYTLARDKNIDVKVFELNAPLSKN
ncbi:MAG: nucleotidyltransferase domain-containing protein [Candidatus Njordarchaeia archaeon]